MCTCWLTTRRVATFVSNKIPNMYATHAPVCLLGALFAFISWEQPCLQSQARFSKWLAELSFLNTGRANIEASKAVSKETQETFGYQHQYESFSLLMLIRSDIVSHFPRAKNTREQADIFSHYLGRCGSNLIFLPFIANSEMLWILGCWGSCQTQAIWIQNHRFWVNSSTM